MEQNTTKETEWRERHGTENIGMCLESGMNTWESEGWERADKARTESSVRGEEGRIQSVRLVGERMTG